MKSFLMAVALILSVTITICLAVHAVIQILSAIVSFILGFTFALGLAGGSLVMFVLRPWEE